MHLNEYNRKRSKPAKQIDYPSKKKKEKVSTALVRFSSVLNLPDTITLKAIQIFEDSRRKQFFKWRKTNAIAGACLYAACKIHGIPRSLSEFMENFDGVGKRRIYGCLKILGRSLNFNTRLPDLPSLLKHQSNLAGFPSRVAVYGSRLLEKIQTEKYIQGKDPNGYIAACLYLACKEKQIKITQAKIASQCKVNTTTLRKRIREIELLARIG